jgi:hypothetical protein
VNKVSSLALFIHQPRKRKEYTSPSESVAGIMRMNKAVALCAFLALLAFAVAKVSASLRLIELCFKVMTVPLCA